MSAAKRNVDLDAVAERCERLKLTHIAECLPELVEEASRKDLAPVTFLGLVLEREIERKEERRIATSLKLSGLPVGKTLEGFDWTFQPSIKREHIESLHELGFLERKENVIFLGPPGVGKTHLALSLAIAAAQHGRRVYYGTLADLITSLEEAQAAGRLGHRLKTLTHPALLLVDEIGYLPITANGAMLFFQLMARRYESASTVLTSNKPFDEWGQIFGDDLLAGALIDRLLHHCHIVNIRGNSYRMRHHQDLWRHLDPSASDDEPSTPNRTRRRREASTTT